jgi:hypothetical protein
MRVQPKRLGNGFFQLELDLKHILARREPRSIAHAEDVRVDRERLLSECGVEHDVRSLAPDARQFLQLVPRAGHLAAVIKDQRFRERDDVLCLGVEQSNGLDRLAQPFFAERDHLLRRFHMLEQGAGRDIHACIGSLRGQDNRNEQGVGIAILKLGRGRGILLGQATEEFEYLFALHRSSMTSRIE